VCSVHRSGMAFLSQQGKARSRLTLDDKTLSVWPNSWDSHPADNPRLRRLPSRTVYPGEEGLACVNLPRNRAEVAVQPVQSFADHLDPRRHVPGPFEDYVPLVLGRRSEQLEHWRLRRFDRVVEIVSSRQEEHRDRYPREEIERFDFGRFNLCVQPTAPRRRRRRRCQSEKCCEPSAIIQLALAAI